MTYFLDRIASHIYQESGDRLDKHCLVFPNRRAGLYFLKYLAQKAGKPIWSPDVKTINELFQSFSIAKLAENEILVFKLYKIYGELNSKAGNLDDFFFWGEMLVNDFDNIDKYLVDASKLFINLKEIKEIDQNFGGLTEEQIGIIRQFWVNFNPEAVTDQKSDFQELWSILLPMYNRFRQSLAGKGLAYEGMIYRDLAEKCRSGEVKNIKWDQIHFIGFNALNNCEKEVMSFLKKSGIARFYWDYDNSFVNQNKNHSAGFFIKDNLVLFGNDMPADWNYNSSSASGSQPATINIIDTSSDIAQVKLASKIVAESPFVMSSEAHHTAIVLADENLLLPALSSLPGNVESVNITMGYPLKYSPVYSLLKNLLALQKNLRTDESGGIIFDQNDVRNIITNSFFTDITGTDINSVIKELNEEGDRWVSQSFFKEKQPFEFIFRKVGSAIELSQYLKAVLSNLYILNDAPDDTTRTSIGISIRNEFIYRVLLAMNRLDSLLTDNVHTISAITFNRLLDRILRALSIPFSGEPLNGIQIMGILETRALDFRNLIILSVNEGILPQNSAGNSFIPFNLREAFGLPTIKHQDSIYSYYFYRLLQRATNVTLIYNSNADGLKTGEMSRFLLQLKYSDTSVSFSNQRFEINASNKVPSEVPRSNLHNEKVFKEYLTGNKKILSPSAVNTWLSCRMKFYWRYICSLKEPDKVAREIDPAIFGRLLHFILERIYRPYKGAVLNKESVISIRKDTHLIENLISDVINEKFYNGKKSIMSGNDLIICDMLKSYVDVIISHDSELVPLEIIEMEHCITSEIEINYDDSKNIVKIGGVIDRLDKTNGIWRITDYKTGNTCMEIPVIESLFDETRQDRNETWFQILMYCTMYIKKNGGKKLRPSVYPVRSMFGENFIDLLTIKNCSGQEILVDDFEIVMKSFDALLKETIEKIFSTGEPFRMTEHLKKCDMCPYARLCQR